MQPDAHAQLAGLRRILDQVVAPAVGDAFAAAQLRAVGETLDQLAAWWPRSLLLLELENAELRALLGEAARGPFVADEPRARIGEIAREGAPAPAALLERTRELRGLLCELIGALAQSPAGAARDTLRARVRRVLRANLERAAGT